MWWSGSKVTDKQLLMQLWRTQSLKNTISAQPLNFTPISIQNTDATSSLITAELKIWEQTRDKTSKNETNKFWSVSQTNHSFEPVLFSELSSLNQTELSETARAAQIYKLLDQNWLPDSDSKWVNRFRENGLTRTEDWWAADMCMMLMCWYVHEPNTWSSTKGSITVYVKRWADEDWYIHFICFRHAKPCFSWLLGALTI